jgi:hypothetical protein
VRRFRQQVEDRRWRRQAIHAAQCCGISLFVMAMLRSCILGQPPSTLDTTGIPPDIEWSAPVRVVAFFVGFGLVVHFFLWYAARAVAPRRPRAGAGARSAQ